MVHAQRLSFPQFATVFSQVHYAQVCICTLWLNCPAEVPGVSRLHLILNKLSVLFGQPLATSHHFHLLFCEGGILDYYCYIGSITIFTLIAIKIKIIIIHFSINIIIIIIIIIGPTKYSKCCWITYSICFVFCCTLIRSFHFLCYFLHFQKWFQKWVSLKIVLINTKWKFTTIKCPGQVWCWNTCGTASKVDWVPISDRLVYRRQ